MATINKTSNIIKLKKSQYDRLKSGEQIDGYSFSDSDVYIPDFNSLYMDIKNATVRSSNNSNNSNKLGGHPADYFATKQDLNSYQPYNSMLTAITKATGTQGVLRRNDFGTWTLDRTMYATLTSKQTFTGKNFFETTNDCSSTSNQILLIGNSTSALCIGGNGLQCFSGTNSSTSSAIYINYYGGDVIIGKEDGTQTIDLRGTIQENGTSLVNKYISKSLTSAKGDMIYASAANTPTRLGIGSNGQFLSIANGIPNWVNNPNTDTKVTAVGNHYTPSGGTSLTASSSGTASRGSTKVLTNITIDAAGHITGGTWYTLPNSDNTNTATAADNILDGSNSGTQITYAPYTSQQSKLSFDTSASAPTRTDRLNLNGYLYATKFNIAGKATMQYNSTEDCIEFIFT